MFKATPGFSMAGLDSRMIQPSDILRGKILIVDDQDANVVLLERVLRGAGYTAVTSTMEPRAVCDLHRKNHYDLILLDLKMPDMDGFQVMEGLHQIDTDGYIPVLVITAQPSHKLKALNAGAKDFISKPFDQAEVLVRVHNMLEVRLLQLETRRLYDQVVSGQQVSDRLLLKVLPHAIAERLVGRSQSTVDNFDQLVAESYVDVTILFADIVGFSKVSQGEGPEVLVGVLSEIFTSFDSIAGNRGLSTIKTVGGAYLAANELLTLSQPDHAIRTAHMALDMVESVDRFNELSLHKLQVRIGIDTGTAIAGVIGEDKFVYGVWGEAINTAQSLQSQSQDGRILISDATRQRLGDPFIFEAHAIDAKASEGEKISWFMNGRNS